jgi:hypothetical protein
MPKAKTKPPRAPRQAKAIVFPVASIGPCRNARNCQTFDTDLANGLCRECWDRTSDGNDSDSAP